MVQKEKYQYAEEAPPDESWWSAVLAEAEAQPAPATGTPDISEELPDQNVDWKWAEMLYKQDEIIKLEVTGYNRGGLLVEDERIKGFVPISHLVGISEENSEEKRKQVLASYIGRSL
ncbi:MAG: hypothetical protein AB1649_31700, partial [Chloroflexota bacterium]